MISALPPDMPPADVRIYCSVEAGLEFGVPAELIYAVSLNEGGRAGLAMRNTNGTYDLGWMQFNTSYLRTLAPYGVRPEFAQEDSCYPWHLAAWRLRGHLEEEGRADFWTRGAYYHSRTPSYNAVYRNRLIKNAARFDYVKAEQYFMMIEDQRRGAEVKAARDHAAEERRKTALKPVADDVTEALNALQRTQLSEVRADVR